jgi:protein AFG1
VGCGKTFIMDTFFSALPPEVPARRVHFHEFMLEVHSRLHAARKAGVRGEPLLHVAKDITAKCSLLCFDEFQVGSLRPPCVWVVGS